MLSVRVRIGVDIRVKIKFRVGVEVIVRGRFNVGSGLRLEN